MNLSWHRHEFDASINLGDESDTETNAPLFIPKHGFVELLAGRRVGSSGDRSLFHRQQLSMLPPYLRHIQPPRFDELISSSF
jgi:hypothetical protein